jgi:tRNA(Ile)-lysidine synthase TilS/MesJ
MVRKAIFDFELLDDKSSKIALALSGGKDSLTLLFLLKAIAGRGCVPFDITAIHVSGEFSCGAGVQLPYLQAICAKLQVPLLVRQSKKTLENLECYSCSRERRSLIFDAAKEAGCSVVAFGHTQDDNAETLIMNLFHKGEFAGILPKITMVDYGVTIIRPLIYIQENDIQMFAKQYEFARITCQCPVGQHSQRKKTEQLLKEFETLYPNIRQNIAHAAITSGLQKAQKMV